MFTAGVGPDVLEDVVAAGGGGCGPDRVGVWVVPTVAEAEEV
jgi:hypothetical protein